MSFDFIQVNNSVLDYSEYIRNVLLLKNYMKHRMIEALLEEGFKMELEKSSSYHQTELVFYNAVRDLEVKISFNKREKELFI